jgi:hypothetical protein
MQISTDFYRCCIVEGEPVEFVISENGEKGNRRIATAVTGPNGANVKGVKKPTFYDN